MASTAGHAALALFKPAEMDGCSLQAQQTARVAGRAEFCLSSRSNSVTSEQSGHPAFPRTAFSSERLQRPQEQSTLRLLRDLGFPERHRSLVGLLCRLSWPAIPAVSPPAATPGANHGSACGHTSGSLPLPQKAHRECWEGGRRRVASYGLLSLLEPRRQPAI